MKEPSIQEVTISKGFWGERAALNCEIAIFYQWQQLESTHCIDNFRIAAGLIEGFREGFFFSDSDAYKWLDAASRLLANDDNPKLCKLVDDFIEILEAAQEADGYLYTYSQIHFKGQRWVNLQVEHEFYCLGHLIEAGISHYEATGEKRLFNLATKAADLLVREFSQAKPDFTDGHEEIEIALLKLWQATNDLNYLALAKSFLEQRGMIEGFSRKMLSQVLDSGKRMREVSKKRSVWLKSHPQTVVFELPAHNRHKVPFFTEPRFVISALSGKYNQQHQPVLNQTKAEGHSVRFAYLKTAEAMLAQVPGQEYRLNLLRNVWEQMVSRRMYVTGGIGSLPLIEGFGRDYELDPEAAYAETCAALGCMLWNHEMSRATGEARFEDLFEWQLYNAASVGIGRDGCSYFYNNPLVSRGETSRAGWYDIPCCPSNLSRIWASLGRNVCFYDQSEIRVNQYISSEIEINSNSKIGLKIESGLPWEGEVKIRFTLEHPVSLNLVLRMPAWTESCVVLVNSKPVEVHFTDALPDCEAANGLNFQRAHWMVLAHKFANGDEVSLCFDMPVRLIKQDKRIRGCGDKVAVTRGPIVYCLESVDHAEDIFKAKIDPSSLRVEMDQEILGGTFVIHGADVNGVSLTFIPYMLWGNRGSSKMTVFVDG